MPSPYGAGHNNRERHVTVNPRPRATSAHPFSSPGRLWHWPLIFWTQSHSYKYLKIFMCAEFGKRSLIFWVKCGKRDIQTEKAFAIPSLYSAAVGNRHLSNKLTFDLLTLKVESPSTDNWPTTRPVLATIFCCDSPITKNWFSLLRLPTPAIRNIFTRRIKPCLHERKLCRTARQTDRVCRPRASP